MTDFQEIYCPQCELPEPACLCHLVPNIHSSATFWLLTHDNEHDKATNTGKLISAIWSQTRVINWSRTEPNRELLEQLVDPSQDFVLVFPQQYAVAGQQKKQLAESGVNLVAKPTSFIILDATWQQARKLYRKSPYLHSLPLLSLLPAKPSVYSLRRNRNKQHLCTAEVAAQVLRQSGEPLQADLLDALLGHFCNQYDWSRKSQRQVQGSPVEQLLREYSTRFRSFP